jgi:hypothetical protein
MYEQVAKGDHATWTGCCNEVSDSQKTVSGWTIREWFLDFLAGPSKAVLDSMSSKKSSTDLFTERFPFSRQGRSKDCKTMSPLTGDDGDEQFAMEFKTWAKANLETLTINGATAKLSTMLGDWTAKQLDHLNIEMPLKPWTVSRWMQDAGFVYSVYKKKYFVNTHEKDDVVKHRQAYVAESLASDIQKACWIQMPLAKAAELFKPPPVAQLGSEEYDPNALHNNMYFEYRHEYHDDTTNTMMVELHVCAFEAHQLVVLLEKKAAVWKLFGGCPSICRNERDKLLIVFGQDESVFKAFAMNLNAWTCDGITTERQKGEGPGMMVSAMQSYEYGFGLELPGDVLSEINRIRAGEHYCDRQAATELTGSSEKPPLTSSPFVVFFELGKGKSGYWAYNHMVTQLEDCVDCLRVICKGEEGSGEKFKYTFAFEFDHSSGHSKQRPDGLSVAKSHVNTGVGGKQALMRDSVMTVGDLGDAPDKILNIGDTATHIFDESDDPPFCDPTMPRLDLIKPGAVPKVTALNNNEIKAALLQRGLHQAANGKRDVLVANARRAGIDVTKLAYSKADIIEGYVGKAKGLKQIAIERGFFSKARMMLSSRDPGFVNSDNLRKIVGACTDFKNETSQLQHIANKLGVAVIMTPKAHAELAGQGIEYSWGYAKLYFRRHNTTGDQAKKLERNIRNALSDDNMTKTRVRKFVRKAREYKVIYHEFFLAKQAAEEEAKEASIDESATNVKKKEQKIKEEAVKRLSKHHYSIIEKQVKAMKAHRCALDTDFNFIKNA